MKIDNKAVKSFVERWTGKGYEKGQSQIFWIELLTEVLGVKTPSEIISFEDQVKLDHTSFIDAYIISTHVMIEQKSIDKDLRASIKQSDGTMLSPFAQAKRYASELPYSKRPRWIVTCNFKSFLIYDMENPQGEPFEILLENLEKEAHMLQFLVEDKSANLKHEMDVSIQAGEIVGLLYDAFREQLNGEETPEDLHNLNVLCVRLVFCLYAEDAGIFGKDQFVEYLQTFRPENMRMALKELFYVLDTEKRKSYLEPKLAAFPYVNGSLFRQQPDEDIPPINDKIADLLIHHASLDFDWSDISPTIFGAVFESTLNPETRRSGGMHYTSIENIHKVIDPLFLNDLHAEFHAIMEEKVEKNRIRKLESFQDKLGELTFLDPACGSGNFLTETYLSLRRLENEVIRARYQGQTMMGAFLNPIKVNINQFYGIEINDFAVTVATTALWISEAQMLAETEKIIHQEIDFLPLKTYTNITEGNALRIDWKEVVPVERLSYIIGNPPFVGARLMSDGQKKDMISTFGTKWKNVGNMDYVSCWYKRASELMAQNQKVRAALVSTNSICQGEQVANLWKPLFEEGLHINFARRTFRWDSEASIKAHVHCIIVGFSRCGNYSEPTIYDGERVITAQNVNAYLIDAPDIFISGRSKPLCDVPEMVFGSMPNDGGFLSDWSTERKNEVINKYPGAEPMFRQLLGAQEFINKKERWCLWLKGISPTLYRNISPIMEAVAAVKDMREKSSRVSTQKLADIPMLFGEIRHTDSEYILVPRVSSERRRYVPMGFVLPAVVGNDSVQIIPNASLYHFGILESNVHMAWMRTVCGRLEMRYRYSANVVYNNFPWPSPTEEQKVKIEQTAQAILDARALYPDSSLADLYDEVTMPPELRKAHQANDRAVMEAYGFPVKNNFTESKCVAELFKLYQKLTS